MKRTSKELKRIARDILNNRYTIPMGAFVTAGLIPSVIGIPFSLSDVAYPTTSQIIIYCLAQFLILLIGQVLDTGVAKIHLNMTRGTDFKLVQLFDPFRQSADRFFGAAFLFLIFSSLLCIPLFAGIYYTYLMDDIFITGIALIAGTLVSLISIVAFTINYQMVFFLLLDQPHLKVTTAFKECRLLMKGNKRRFLYILFSFIGWNLLIVCSFGIAGLWIHPYQTQTLITLYLDCTGELDQIPVRDYQKQSAPFSNPFI